MCKNKEILTFRLVYPRQKLDWIIEIPRFRYEAKRTDFKTTFLRYWYEILDNNTYNVRNEELARAFDCDLMHLSLDSGELCIFDEQGILHFGIPSPKVFDFSNVKEFFNNLLRSIKNKTKVPQQVL